MHGHNFAAGAIKRPAGHNPNIEPSRILPGGCIGCTGGYQRCSAVHRPRIVGSVKLLVVALLFPPAIICQTQVVMTATAGGVVKSATITVRKLGSMSITNTGRTLHIALPNGYVDVEATDSTARGTLAFFRASTGYPNLVTDISVSLAPPKTNLKLTPSPNCPAFAMIDIQGPEIKLYPVAALAMMDHGLWVSVW